MELSVNGNEWDQAIWVPELKEKKDKIKNNISSKLVVSEV